MSKVLIFTQIADSRFCDDPLAEITRIDEALHKTFFPYYYVNLTSSKPYRCDFADNYQYRIEYTLTKDTRKLTWNDVYKKINNIKPVPYRFV